MIHKIILSIVIPTYRREGVLLDTLGALLQLMAKTAECCELIVVDQTEDHDPSTTCKLEAWRECGAIKWLRASVPHVTRSMNIGVLEARGSVVLFLDDDIIPCEELLRRHIDVYENPDISAVAGQVLQPWDKAKEVSYRPHGGVLKRYLDFPFFSMQGTFVENVMAGNLSVRKKTFCEVGGFDENFAPPVASRFETEFAKRLVAAGGRIRFAPGASIRHLRVGQGGTRSCGSHLTSASPRHGVGDYYYALLHGTGWDRFCYMAIRPFREVRTKFHLAHPWYIPVKFLGELRAIVLAVRLARRGQALLGGSE